MHSDECASVSVESCKYVAVHRVRVDVRASIEQVILPCTVVGSVSCSVGTVTKSAPGESKRVGGVDVRVPGDACAPHSEVLHTSGVPVKCEESGDQSITSSSSSLESSR